MPQLKITLYVFQAVPPPIIRSSNCTYSFWYLSNCNNICNKLLVNINIALIWCVYNVCVHIYIYIYFIEINKLRNVASCWLHFGNILRMHRLMNTKYLRCSKRLYFPAPFSGIGAQNRKHLQYKPVSQGHIVKGSGSVNVDLTTIIFP
jgi:hypothetical protein